MKNKNIINSYSFGEIIVNDKTYINDLIIFPNKIRTNWQRKEGHKLSFSDLKKVISFSPEILIIGTGESGIMKVSKPIKEKIEGKDIALEVRKTGLAYKIFNQKLKEGKKVVGAFHLTC